MESSSKLQITLHSGKGLCDVKNFGTMDPYALVWIAGDDGKQSNPCKTETAKKGASCPVWECCMEFNVAASMHVDNYTLFCDIKHDGKLFDREIGCVRVPFKDLLAGGSSGEKLHYPVTNCQGEVEGEIILSHKFSGVSSGKKYATALKVAGDGPGKKDGTGLKVAGGGPGKKDGTGRKVASGGPGKKVEPKKKTKKQKDGMMKGIAKKMAKKVAAEVAMAAAVTGIVFAVGVDEVGDVDGVEDQAEEGVVDEEGDVDGEEEDDEGDFDGEEDVDQGDFDGEEDVDQEDED